jgi:electron transfer flavoprotein-quinone oxidoreductase
MSSFDAIVVGAGPAGCAAAYEMARADLSVLVLERGADSGVKNSSGAVLFGDVLSKLIPHAWPEAPVERPITRQSVALLTESASLEVSFDIHGPASRWASQCFEPTSIVGLPDKLRMRGLWF